MDPLRADFHAVRRLTLTDFRCYSSARLDLDARPVVLYGPNGAGKTNLLEALSFLVPGRGLRRARLAEVSRRVPGDEASGSFLRPWAVAVRLQNGSKEIEIGTGLLPASDALEIVRPRRVVRIEGREARNQAALGERVAALWLTPDMQRLFVEGASARRQFFDRLIFAFEPAHAGRLQAYGKALRDRARVLADAAVVGKRADVSWLEAVESIIVEKGIAIAAARANLIRRLNPACCMGIGPFPAAGLKVNGEIDTWLEQMSALDAEDKFSDVLKASRGYDKQSGQASTGPHISDIEVTHLNQNVYAAQCSTGEQKALLISIVLANARLQALETGSVPLLLLDEVTAHLDEQRRIALFDELLALGAQAWMSSTDVSLFASLDTAAQYFAVSNAQITPVA